MIVSSYLLVLCTVFFTVYSQLAIKWSMLRAGVMPEGAQAKAWFLFSQLLDPWILSSIVSAFLALITWMVAMTRLELSHAYPFMSLAFVLVLFFSHALFDEGLSTPKIVGVLFIAIGLAVGSKG